MPKGVYKRGPRRPFFRGRPEDRFWRRVEKTDSCWLWTGAKVHKGYGRHWLGKLKDGGDYILAHRYSYILAFGEIPNDLFVCHACDVPACVRPDHLWLGTNADNMRDAAAKGRTARGERNAAYLYPERVTRGSRNGYAKLTEDDVRAIRAALRGKVATQKELGLQYGVGQTTISHLWRRDSWAHIE